MRFAVIGDIHSNLFALDAVLLDISRKNVDFILCTGDNVGYSPYPNEVINRLKSNHILSIQGNYDKAIGNRELICGCDYTETWLQELAAQSMAFTGSVISDGNREYLKNLPKDLRLRSDGLNILVVHGSPRRINEFLYEDSPELLEVMDSIPDQVLIYGHTHGVYYSQINGKHVINSGTVGKPNNAKPDATYVVVEIVNDSLAVEIVEVPYDYEKAARAIEDTEALPNEFAEMLRNGGY